ncbi:MULTISPECIES: phosphatase PAP2 family protein [Kitasatospora]|uniref:Putative phosphatase n=1 Tax=Kitasatospora setae (strain ATCC 33774 / DSM 43861 / JCM 3304 / KCC A-0304 / NBRC 14216 / KM-6054) TaxID=452652 RepID=E4NF53_KITSK|nr:phosphatase PAP2 family protein [Kitasatospora setae]BAJ30133.1 putative phosphatase [Kitasatospora setae KM-6054]
MPTLLADAGTGSGDPDLGLLKAVNGLAADAPGWLDSLVAWTAEYGILLGLAAIGLTAWLTARRRPDAPVAVAGVLWAPLAVAIAELANLPVSRLVDRPRPFVTHPELDVLVPGKEDTLSFVSDHSAMSMGIAVALFLVNRRLGLAAGALALLQGFCRLFVGVHYPTDVLGGYALATAVVLLLAPIAMAVLVPLCHALSRTALRPLVAARVPAAGAGGRRSAGAGARRSGRRAGPGRGREPERDRESDLAA